MRPNVQGKPGGGQRLGQTAPTAARLDRLVGPGFCFCFREPINDQTTINWPTDNRTKNCCLLFRDGMAEQHKAARQTIKWQLCVCVFVWRSKATGNQLAGRRSEAIVFVVCCSGIERRTAINSATDIRAGVHDSVLCSRSSAERQSICRTTISRHCVLLRALQEPINHKRALRKPIE